LFFFGYIYGVEYYTDICSVSDYIAALKRLRCENLCSECIEQDVFYYRGEPHDYGNTAGLPSINRGDYLERDNESELFRECERRLPEEFANCRSTFEKLVKMQHYGVKTRLLDISQDPLQALFFSLYIDPADNGERDDDAVVFAYKIPKKQICNWHSDKVSVVSNVAAYSFDDLRMDLLPDDINAFNKSDSIHHLLHEIRAEKPHFRDEIVKEHLSQVYCVHPLLANPRIRSQQGAFLLYGINGDRHHLADLELSGIQKIALKIPHKAKIELMQEMWLLGRTIDCVYPDWRGIGDFFSNFWKRDIRKYYGES